MSNKLFRIEVIQAEFDQLYNKYNDAFDVQTSGKVHILYYMSDGLLYSLWKYAYAQRLSRKSLLSLFDLVPLEGVEMFTIFYFIERLKELDVEIEGIHFSEKIYKSYCPHEHKALVEYIEKKPDDIFSKSLNNLFRNKATFEDINGIFGAEEILPNNLKFNLKGLIEFTEFSPNPSDKNLQPVRHYIENYIKAFIEDLLSSHELNNFYKFDRQKEIFLNNIKHDVNDYGLRFVFRQGKEVCVPKRTMVSIGEDKGYLFIHTLVALETLHLYQVGDIMIVDMDTPPEKQTNDYKIKIYGTEKLQREIDSIKFDNLVQDNKSRRPIPSIANDPPIHKIEIVSGRLKVDGLKESLDKISHTKKETDKPKFPYKLPAGTTWEAITMKFENNENIYIQVKQYKHTASYKELGLVGRGKNPNPSELWAFLKVLSQVNGELTIKDTQAKDKYKKQKELLAKALQSYFSLDYDPFYPYHSSTEKQGNSYKIKITLIPLQSNNSKCTTAAEEDDDLGVEEYLKEQAPQVNEE